MKRIAIVTDDQQSVSPHFGRATLYVVVTVEEDRIVDREVRPKAGHHDFQGEGGHRHEGQDDARGHGFGRRSAERHRQMFANIADCQMLIARGMGQGAYQGLQQMGIRPVLTDIGSIDEAVQAALDGTIVDHTERLH
jgi:predicted Fe-Mo cluster-binding NifX family protein